MKLLSLVVFLFLSTFSFASENKTYKGNCYPYGQEYKAENDYPPFRYVSSVYGSIQETSQGFHVLDKAGDLRAETKPQVNCGEIECKESIWHNFQEEVKKDFLTLEEVKTYLSAEFCEGKAFNNFEIK